MSKQIRSKTIFLFDVKVDCRTKKVRGQSQFDVDTGCPVNKKTLLLTSGEAGQHAIAPGSMSKEAHTPVDSNEGFCMSIRQF